MASELSTWLSADRLVYAIVPPSTTVKEPFTKPFKLQLHKGIIVVKVSFNVIVCMVRSVLQWPYMATKEDESLLIRLGTSEETRCRLETIFLPATTPAGRSHTHGMKESRKVEPHTLRQCILLQLESWLLHFTGS